MKELIIRIRKIRDNHMKHYKQQVQRTLNDLGYEFHIWEVTTKHRLEELKRELVKE